ncbi:amino acid ABC transporter, ATP-binding protein [Labilithrix luteola]|uniref:Amino acid ABC transporter, ATP-binding protein n=1 Tax=Labilithrix luteola TaxID=1391654 RepID=A0A0K1QC83_9BACT|nr:amino acid ABC transporter ATP-binding protein [Labilithrix luteola]AKV03262.1 amino acid ABC transporter, ATP-binding protein [Labilithrix luteola]
MIALENLTKRFDGRTVLDGVNVRFEEKRISCLVGSSGCGKSTLLRCINGLERFDAGRIEVDGVSLGPTSRGGEDRAALAKIRAMVGMVFQQYGLFSHMTALANVMEAPVHVRGMARSEARERASHLLERVGLAHRMNAFPRELSGGEQQRVAIARALAMQPRALLLDEPTSALDPARKVEIIRLLGDLAKDGTTMIIVTHEPSLVRSVADRAILLRDGRVRAEGAPSEVLSSHE